MKIWFFIFLFFSLKLTPNTQAQGEKPQIEYSYFSYDSKGNLIEESTSLKRSSIDKNTEKRFVSSENESAQFCKKKGFVGALSPSSNSTNVVCYKELKTKALPFKNFDSESRKDSEIEVSLPSSGLMRPSN